MTQEGLNAVKIFRDNLTMQICSDMSFQETLYETNAQLYKQGSSSYIEHMQVYDSGQAILFITNIYEKNVDICNIGGLPRGMANDYGDNVTRYVDYKSYSGEVPVYNYHEELDEIYKCNYVLPPSPIDLACTITDMIKNYILENYDRNRIQEIGSYIYDIVEQKLSDFTEEAIDDCIRNGVNESAFKGYKQVIRDIIHIDDFYDFIEEV